MILQRLITSSLSTVLLKYKHEKFHELHLANLKKPKSYQNIYNLIGKRRIFTKVQTINKEQCIIQAQKVLLNKQSLISKSFYAKT